MKRLLQTSLIIGCMSWIPATYASDLSFVLGGDQEEHGQYDLCLLLSKVRTGAQHIETYVLVDPKSAREITFGFVLAGEVKKSAPPPAKQQDAPSSSSCAPSTQETSNTPEAPSYLLPTNLSPSTLGYLPSLADNGDELKIIETFLRALQVELLGKAATASHEDKIQGATFHRALKSTKRLEPLLETGEESYFQGTCAPDARMKRQRTLTASSSTSPRAPALCDASNTQTNSFGRIPFTRDHFLSAIYLEEKRQLDEQKDLAEAMTRRDIRFEHFFLPPAPRVGTGYISLFFSSQAIPEETHADSWTMAHCRKVSEEDPSSTLDQFKEWLSARMGVFYKKYVDSKPTGMHG